MFSSLETTIRNALTRLFRPSYHVYIRSRRWRKKAEAAKHRAGQRCQVCNRHRNDVELHAHHRTYDRLGFELLMDITVLCARCHVLFHGKDNLR